MTTKISIEGINLSEKLIGANIRNLSGHNRFLDKFCRKLAESHINISFLSTFDMETNNRITCCVAEKYRHLFKEIIISELGNICQSDFIFPVGLLSIFPHRFNLKVFGKVLGAFADSEIYLHGVTSSISAISFVIDFECFNKAIQVLKGSLDFQPDQIYSKKESA